LPQVRQPVTEQRQSRSTLPQQAQVGSGVGLRGFWLVILPIGRLSVVSGQWSVVGNPVHR